VGATGLELWVPRFRRLVGVRYRTKEAQESTYQTARSSGICTPRSQRSSAEISAFIRTDGQTDMATDGPTDMAISTRLVIPIKNAITLYGRKRFLLPVGNVSFCLIHTFPESSIPVYYTSNGYIIITLRVTGILQQDMMLAICIIHTLWGRNATFWC